MYHEIHSFIHRTHFCWVTTPQQGWNQEWNLCCVDIWQKPIQYCKAIILQLKINKVETYIAAKSLHAAKSCQTLCNPIDGSPPGSPVPGILQARTLEGVAISFYNAWKWKVKLKSLSRVRLLAAPWTVAHQAPPSMGFSRQEYWSGVPLPSPETYIAIS